MSFILDIVSKKTISPHLKSIFLAKWMPLVMGIVSKETFEPKFESDLISKMDDTCDGHRIYQTHLNLNAEMINISALSLLFFCLQALTSQNS